MLHVGLSFDRSCQRCYIEHCSHMHDIPLNTHSSIPAVDRNSVWDTVCINQYTEQRYSIAHTLVYIWTHITVAARYHILARVSELFQYVSNIMSLIQYTPSSTITMYKWCSVQSSAALPFRVWWAHFLIQYTIHNNQYLNNEELSTKQTDDFLAAIAREDLTMQMLESNSKTDYRVHFLLGLKQILIFSQMKDVKFQWHKCLSGMQWHVCIIKNL